MGPDDLDEFDIQEIIQDELDSEIQNNLQIIIQGRLNDPTIDFDSEDILNIQGINEKMVQDVIDQETTQSLDDLLGTELIAGRVVIYRTMQDAKVDDTICLPLEGESYEIDSQDRIVIPDETHPNCRCWYEDAITGENLGQF